MVVVGALEATTIVGGGREGGAEGAKTLSVGVRLALPRLFDPAAGAALLVGSWGRCRARGGVDGEQNKRGST